MGSILAPFRPSGPLCFPVREGAFSASGGRAAAATGATGGFYVSLYKPWYKNLSKTQKKKQNYCFSRVSEGTLDTFWARFWHRSVLQGHCVSLSGRLRFELREEEQQQQQQEQQEGVTVFPRPGGCVGITTARKLVENYCFSTVLDDTSGTF